MAIIEESSPYRLPPSLPRDVFTVDERKAPAPGCHPGVSFPQTPVIAYALCATEMVVYLRATLFELDGGCPR